MLKLLNEYINSVHPTEQFLGLACTGNKIKVAYASHTDIATIKDGKLIVSVEERRSTYEKVPTRAFC